MGKLLSGELFRGAVAVVLVVSGLIPVSAVTASQTTPLAAGVVAIVDTLPADGRLLPARDADPLADVVDPNVPLAVRWSDDAAKVSLLPPTGWLPTPASALNPPGEPVFELARFQLRARDASLYAQPIPLTSGLLLDAGAVISIGLAREDSDLVTLELATRAEREEAGRISGFLVVDEENVYEGLHTLVRTYFARDTQRRLVVRVVAPEDEWCALASRIHATLASLRAATDGPNGPATPVPAPPPAPEPVAAAAVAPAPDPSAELRVGILTRATSLLGTPYVWGGNSPGRAMDCSAYVSWIWGVSRYTTDSIWAVSHFIDKDEMRPGDAMNLTIGQDPRRRGHIRLFEAWANEARTLMWVYEETPPRAVHRVIAYDPRYQSIRLNGLSGAGLVPLVIALPSAVERVREDYGPAAPPRQAPRATPRPTARPTAKPTARPTATVRPTLRPSATPLRTAGSATPRPSGAATTARPAGATATPRRATPRPSIPPSPGR